MGDRRDSYAESYGDDRRQGGERRDSYASSQGGSYPAHLGVSGKGIVFRMREGVRGRKQNRHLFVQLIILTLVTYKSVPCCGDEN